MQLQEKVAEDLRRSTVVITLSSPWAGGDYGGGLGTVVGDRYVVTSAHILDVLKTGRRLHVWHPEDELKQDFSIIRHWDVGENSLIEVDRVLPFPPYPVARKPVEEVVKPGATVVYPGGYEYYVITGPHQQIPINVGFYNSPAGCNEYYAWGRISHGSSGGGVVSVEDQVLIGIVYGMPTAAKVLEQNIFFCGASNLSGVLDSAGIPRTPEASESETVMGEQLLPEVQNRYFRWAILTLAGVGGMMIAKSLLE